ncbi:MAG: DNA polymerase-3 subunit beta [Candidatus Omnitrophota bacterium]|jgi:DNA polymerase-3 subunit beta
MRISVQKENLLRGIQVVQNAVSNRASLPILANILIEANDNEVSLTATDLDIAITCNIPANIKETGEITIPAKKFGDIIKELKSDEEISISIEKGNNILIESKNIYFKLPGLPKDDFPQIPLFNVDKNTITLSQPLLASMIRKTAFAMSRDEARYVLNGTLFSFNNKKLRLVATDGRRLAKIDKELDKPVLTPKDIVIPTKTVLEIARNLGEDGEVQILFKDSQLQFKIGATIITSRLIDGEFPNYEQVIPQKTKEKLVLNTREFLAATKRASLFTNQDSQSIRINLNKDRMIIAKNTPDVGEAHEEIKTEYKGPEFEIGFNPTFLIDALKNIDDENVRFELIDPEKPGVIKTDDDYTYIILPMQLT